jgi:hypothetical protein
MPTGYWLAVSLASLFSGNYVDETAANTYVAEDGTTIYVTER